MKEFFEQIKSKKKIRVIAGGFLVVLGLILHIIPLFPAGWIIVIGLEILGIRLLLQDKIKGRLGNYKIFNCAKNMTSDKIKKIVIIVVVSLVLISFILSLVLGY